MSDQYFIKSGYQINTQTPTFGTQPDNYWTDWRLQITAIYQYHVYQYGAQIFRNRAYRSLLDVGCGPPLKLKTLFAPYCDDITLIDQPAITDLIAEIMPNAQFIGANLETIDIYLGRTFDLIICADVVEHLLAPNLCVDFIYKCLAPGGIAILSTPERDHLRGKDCNASPKPEHVREWNSAEFAQYVTSRGFTVIEHLLYPQAKVSRAEFLLSRLIPGVLWQTQPDLSRRWGSCQALICKHNHTKKSDPNA